MHVWTGRAAGRTHHGDGLSALHGVTDRHHRLRVVSITGGVAVAVIDLDQIAIALAPSRPGHDTGGHGQHTGAGGEIHALVHGLLAVERIHALAKIRGDVTLTHRPARRLDLRRQLPAQDDAL